ncbi:methyltransferase domain-containing protein [Sphingomonas sp. KR1UV-12]|uniref:Methyltransferase domain-containing protein n=1 Tax=Sphingomonas aurea TaxID=3063994 RepID=A0ABT9EN38_9SPHN|nr:methyltransferase domain-containing protein [Sphingomonas sp. KR1UV-12]MDP1028375.1 methyltransferase domain-containing protein [Sphingomonas sp. KR1UV-12]
MRDRAAFLSSSSPRRRGSRRADLSPPSRTLACLDSRLRGNDGRWLVPTLLALTLTLAACDGTKPLIKHEPDKPGPFPAADRPVARIVSSRWSNEDARDRLREAKSVMDGAAIRPGMTIADIGAGEGYYTIRLAARVGKEGRVLAEDVVPAVRDQLAERVSRERLENVSVRLGEPADPKLPDDSFDRVLMVHMYHEIAQPYEFLWRLRPSLKPDGLVVVVDANRRTQDHGTPPALLRCEFAAVGYRQVSMQPMPSAGGYLATFRAEGPRPEPAAIKPCRLG